MHRLREVVCRLLSLGLSPGAVAWALGVSRYTVYKYARGCTQSEGRESPASRQEVQERQERKGLEDNVWVRALREKAK